MDDRPDGAVALTGPVVSVVTPVRNGERHLPRFFAALDAQTLPAHGFEVVLVDDGSTDATPRLAAAWAAADPERRRVVRSRGDGPAAARNAGIAAARAPWIASTDCDCVPETDWLEAGLAAAGSNGAGALEGAIDLLEPVAAGAYTTAQRNLSGGRYMTGNMFYRRDVVNDVGGFDTSFEQQFLEDSELAFRILDAGWEIPFAPNVVVRHPVDALSVRDAARLAKKLQWLPLLARKHPNRYREQLRPVLPAVNRFDLEIVAGLAAAGAAMRAPALVRLVLLGVVANGARRALGRRREGFSSALVMPPLRLFWWIVGCLRFRTFVR